ncbi:MAG: hypothetical protein ACFFE8_09295 [Candidatus Heimdallarchaeota archaeon]
MYTRTTQLRRKWSRFYTQYPELFVEKISEGVFTMRNCGKTLALILTEWRKERGNIEISVLEPVRLDDLENDSDLTKVAFHVEREGLDAMDSAIDDPEFFTTLDQLEKKRFSVLLSLR